MEHPYKGFPARQFWGRSVSRHFDPQTLGDFPKPLIGPDDQVVTAGSCFAANLIPYLEMAGLKHLRTEFTHPIFASIPSENLSYGKFSAGYGNIYTARQLLQLLKRSTGDFEPQENCWRSNGLYLDPFRPALAYAARSEREFEAITKAHLRAVRQAFMECSVFVFTLGLTEAWVSTADGAVFPVCPGTIAGEFDPDRHTFVNFAVSDVIEDMREFVGRLRDINPGVRLILTVSPVPLVATAAQRHVLTATVYSKSVLRVADETIAVESENVHYFPAYEIVTGPQAPDAFFEDDRRNVSQLAVATVMDSFLAACGSPASDRASGPDVAPQTTLQQLSAKLAEIECEEAALAV